MNQDRTVLASRPARGGRLQGAATGVGGGLSGIAPRRRRADAPVAILFGPRRGWRLVEAAPHIVALPEPDGTQGIDLDWLDVLPPPRHD